MTDTMPPIAPAPQNLTNETKQSAAAMYRANGYSDDAIKAAGYDPAFTPPAGQVVPPVNNNTPVTQTGSNTPVMRSGGISHDEALRGGKAAIAAGVDPNIVIEALKYHGVTAAELNYTPPSKEAVQNAADEAKLHASMQVPASANEYEITYDRGFAQAMEIDELQAFDVETRTAMQAAGVPRSMAQGFVEAIIDTGEIYANESMTDAARQLRWKEEGAIFKRMSRDPEQDAAYAQLAYNALPKGYREILDANYALHSARSQMMLANLGRALEYRANKMKG